VAAGASQAPAASSIVANDLSSGATPDMQRTAKYWANMEPDNVAKVLPKLPIPYVARVLALMSPDDVGAILDALPAAYAAQLTQEHPELKR
jgi:flagellar motility protein MotE (MotC chaperone)